MFGELTDDDLQPVATVRSVSASKAPNPYANAGQALEKYVTKDQLTSFTATRQDYEIAGLGARLGGAVLDWLFHGIGVAIGVAVVVGMNVAGFELAAGPFYTQWQFWAMFGCIMVPIMINWVLISSSGQSLGKKAVGTVIVDEHTGAPVGFSQGVGRRWIAWGFITGIPVIGGLIALADVFSVFRENHRTFHDQLADTLVAVKSP